MSVTDILEKTIDACFACIPRKKPNANAISQARLVAHRGAHDAFQNIAENTDAAFQRALDLGLWGIEFDVHATADNVLVVNHDPDLRRIWGHDVTIAKTPYQIIHEMVPDVPTLDEVVKRYGKRLHLFVELKSPFTAFQSLYQSLSTLSPTQDYHLLSLDEALFEQESLFPKEALLLVPTQSNTKRFVQISLEEGYGGVLGHYLLMRSDMVKRLKTAQQMVGVGFVDSKYSLYRELNRDIHYLFTNRAESISTHLKALRVSNLAE